MSVVVPTYNRVRRLREVVAALSHQTVPAAEFEVIVVSDGATDGTDQFVREVTTPFRLVFVSQANRGPAAARNHGARLAAGQLLLFIDDDVVPQPDLIEEHLRTHEDHDGQVVVVGPMLTPPYYRPGVYVRWEQAMLYKQYRAMTRGDYAATYRQFYTGNASLPRDLFLQAGGFDERFHRAEDVELAYRLHLQGARFTFNQCAIGHHYAERSFRSWLQNARDYGRNDVLFGREQGHLERVAGAGREFGARHLLIRWLTQCCVGRRGLETVLGWAVRCVAVAGDRLGCHRMTQLALSSLYNTTYYCGMADELGDPRAFRELVEGARLPSAVM